MTKYVGHSYGRCVADIYEGLVNYDGIYVIVTRTRFDPENTEQWNEIWDGYTRYNGYTANHWIKYAGDNEAKEEFYKITKMLNEDGKLHQPRNYGSNSSWSLPYVWSKVEPVDYEELKKSDGEKWELPKKSDISDEDLKKLIGAMI